MILGCLPSKTKPENTEKEPVEKPSQENGKGLTRIGSKFYSKDTHTERKFNIGFRVEKTPGGVGFKTQNELVVDKQRVFKRVNKEDKVEEKGEENEEEQVNKKDETEEKGEENEEEQVNKEDKTEGKGEGSEEEQTDIN